MKDNKELLIKGLYRLNIYPTESIISSFETYLYELKKWNRTYNLTSLEKDEDIIIKHFLDSLLYTKIIPEKMLNICDIGSGAGFPGIPIAIVRPQVNVSLIEPSRKKTAFLRHMKRILSLKNVEILEKRAEDIPHDHFDIGVSRALFSIEDLIKKASHLIKEDGYFILSKGPRYKEELVSIPRNVKIETFELDLPFSDTRRYLIKISLQRS